MENILRKEFPPADRPYSQNELTDMRERILARLKVGNTMVYHEQTGYFYLAKAGGKNFYLAKAGGKKEKAVQNGESLDPAGCSVCWKLRKTPQDLREEARDMVEAYQVNFEKKPEKWSLNLVNLEATFYKWLYLNFDKRDRGRRFGSRNNDEHNQETNHETVEQNDEC